MLNPIQQQLIEQITAEWKSAVKGNVPSGVWICEYPPLPMDADSIGHPMRPVAVWFLSQAGLQQKSIEEWERLLASNEHEVPAVSGRRFLTGFAAFAPYEDGNSYYLEYQWGPLWGRGWRWAINEEGRLHGRDELWIS